MPSGNAGYLPFACVIASTIRRKIPGVFSDGIESFPILNELARSLPKCIPTAREDLEYNCYTVLTPRKSAYFYFYNTIFFTKSCVSKSASHQAHNYVQRS